ncbi:MAG TPA: hypothetical protein VGE07_26460 [Herpetosiphonaceae bacterium]
MSQPGDFLSPPPINPPSRAAAWLLPPTTMLAALAGPCWALTLLVAGFDLWRLESGRRELVFPTSGDALGSIAQALLILGLLWYAVRRLRQAALGGQVGQAGWAAVLLVWLVHLGVALTLPLLYMAASAP